MVTTTSAGQVVAAELVRPVWLRVRFWLALAVAAALGAVTLGVLTDAPTRPLDPTSTAEDGSRALARVVEGYGVPVERATSIAAATGTDTTVLVTSADAYSDAQLRRISRAAGRVVLLAPGERTLRAVLPAARVVDADEVAEEPGCRLSAATAAGGVDWPEDTVAYRAATSCYGGAVAADAGAQPDVVVLGSGAVLQNQNLGGRGTAALAVNLLTADRTASRVVWLLPGADAAGDGEASIWDLFPDGVYRVFWWLVAVGVALALWRARRLGGVVSEPLPVIVRAAELVEGHGRLYERAGARDHAAAALRAAVARRMADRVALPWDSSAGQVAALAAPLLDRSLAELTALLAGPPPGDDAGLVRLARELDRLDVALGDALREGRS